MQSRDTFSSYNPAITFMFFIGAVVFGMFFIHPLFLICSFCLSAAYYLTIRGRQGVKFIAGMIPLFVFLSIFSPLLNTYGDTVLFTYFGGRHYTFESLCCGMAVAAMLVTVLTWFASYNIVMTADKFMYLFGKRAPAISLVLSTVLRLVPSFRKKLNQIATARKCIGKAGESGAKREKIENGMTLISTLVTWALEGGIVMADSMRARGYGAGQRTNFAIYRFDLRDAALMAFMTTLIIIILFCGIMGGMSAEYTPTLNIAKVGNPYTLVGIAAYFIFLSIPVGVNIREAIIWRTLRSRI